MNGFASALAAIALLQGEPAPPVAPSPAKVPAAAEAAAARAATPTSTSNSTPTPTPTATATATATPTSTPTSTSTSTSTATGAATASGAAPRTRVDPALERAEAERVARAFLGALAGADAAGLAEAAAERFSFDGDAVAGREAIRGRWRALLAGRPGPPPRVGEVEVLPAADAVARLGKPPPRVAPLARPGAWVAIGDVGGRAVVLFVAREAGRMAVLGVHD